MKNKLLPLSKSWAIRMILLDMLYGAKTHYRIIRHFEKQNKKSLSYDAQSAVRCAKNYISGKNIYYAGDSGTLCRFLIYILDGQKYKIIKRKQLAERKIKTVKNISKLPLSRLLQLGTTQFAGAALLIGAKPIKNLPPKCELSVEARKTYFKNNGKWIPKIDEIFTRQLNHFLNGGEFKPRIAEDYCYARAFNLITQKEGKRRWPELANHECNRLAVMEEICKNFNRRLSVHSDHRVAMAGALRQISLGLPIRVNSKKCVAKSWPQFWQWLKKNS